MKRRFGIDPFEVWLDCLLSVAGIPCENMCQVLGQCSICMIETDRGRMVVDVREVWLNSPEKVVDLLKARYANLVECPVEVVE